MAQFADKVQQVPRWSRAVAKVGQAKLMRYTCGLNHMHAPSPEQASCDGHEEVAVKGGIVVRGREERCSTGPCQEQHLPSLKRLTPALFHDTPASQALLCQASLCLTAEN